MHALSASELMVAWERGANTTPIGQALAILRVALPQIPDETLEKLDVAQRDLYLLRLRSLTFGPQLKGLTACQACGEQLELDLNTDTLRSSAALPTDFDTMMPIQAQPAFRLNDYEVVFRLPNSMDLQFIDDKKSESNKREQLLEACILSILHHEQKIGPSELPAGVVTALMDHMSKVASLADLTITLSCPSCGHAWDLLFDIVSFFWSEINAWAARLIHEVHILAMAYGWSESDILAMSAWRRQQYLQLIGVR